MDKDYPEQKYLISSRNLGNNCIDTLCELSRAIDIGLSWVTALNVTDKHFKRYCFYNLDYKKQINIYDEYLDVFCKFQQDYPNEMGAI